MHECRADGGKAHCDCKAGFTLAADGKTCEGKLSSSGAGGGEEEGSDWFTKDRDDGDDDDECSLMVE